MFQPIERLRDDILVGGSALGADPVAIGDYFSDITEGVRYILRSYDQVILGHSQVDLHGP